eukprot:TRINITY_DN75105_c0_g1_i1.p1 TRINITY_DN75105_c0_g1~~TRINITY_DN75105_c0_g1_i1.p1  ORF type:complete len:106 (-),score=17.55 TRINITY_DN75105_c0_g1_i1:553-870(-)
MGAGASVDAVGLKSALRDCGDDQLKVALQHFDTDSQNNVESALANAMKSDPDNDEAWGALKSALDDCRNDEISAAVGALDIDIQRALMDAMERHADDELALSGGP